ncbi:leucine-rich repeat domain-containing protein [Adlercreutzia equolifaciens]|uniref:leucine-rich repeat domain-containing protein n=1 Tax=Adlercreutzia equolifaciens TaxID=446660 RepID=UPI0023AEE327|nr:leucine-rich repeat domain-containing protein [Adlercreutzia equolifaciens]MDE8701865.1 leucine-rich repeat domain-containing protein [Adlercreutzia equolifaciens]
MLNNPSQHLAKKTLAAVLTACLVVPAVPFTAFADTATANDGVAAADSTVDCGNWLLSYRVEDGKAVITGYDYRGTAGSADLAVPSTIAGMPVVALAENAFNGCKTLAKVTIPDSVMFIEAQALRNTSATEIHFGKGLRYIEQAGVANNASLKVVDFAAGCAPEFFQQNAFASNTALEEIRVPALVGTAYRSKWYSKNGTFRIGQFCFYNCPKLKTVTYEAGNPNSYQEYYSSEIYEVYSGMGSDFSIVSYTPLYPTNGGYVTKARDAYFAVYFYDSKAASDADATGARAKAVALISKGVSVTELSAGTLADEDYYQNGAAGKVPSLSQMGVSSSDMVWGLADMMLTSATSTLTNVVHAYPVSKSDMGYAYLTSAATDLYNSYSNQVTADRKENAAFHRLRADGTTDLSAIQVHAADGSVVDPGSYTLKYLRQNPADRGQAVTYTELSGPDKVNAAGTYAVYAVGTGSNAATKSRNLTFYVRRYDADVVDYTGKTALAGSASALYTASRLVKKASFVTLAPASSWQACLVATAAAGMGGGLAIYSDGTDGNDGFYQAIGNTGSKYLVSVGSASAIGAKAVSRAKLVLGNGTVSSSLDGTASSGVSYEESLACTVYEKLKKAGTTQRFAWGDTAVVVSRSSCLNTAAVAQYAYALKAPVFFANASGGLSAATLKNLADFKQVVIAGSSQQVSDAAASQIAQACGAEPRRVMTGATAVEASCELAALMMEEGLATNASVNVASSATPVSVFTAAQCAALNHGITLASSSSLETKQAEAYLATLNVDAMNEIRLLGALTSAKGTVASRFAKLSQGQPQTTALEVGDTAAVGALRYKLTSATTAQVDGFTQAAASSVTVPATVEVAPGKTVKVTAIGASAFKGQTALKTVKLSGNIQSIGASAFQGCTKLTSISGGSALKTVGASAFQNCAALTTVSLGSALTSVGASAFQSCTGLTKIALGTNLTSLGASAFQGCAKLTTVTLGSKLTSIPSKAFYGCAKLKTFALPASCTSVGASAFYGCKVMTKVTGGAKVKTIGASAFQGCAKLKAVALGAKLTTIGSKAFSGCSALSSLTIPAAVKKIGASAFSSCKKLTTLKVKSTKLTKAGVKGALKGSSVKKISLTTASAKKKLTTYKKYFTKANAGKAATVVKG